MSGDLWTLRITTFKGLSFRASHYYVALHGPEYQASVYYVMSAADAALISDHTYTFNASESSERFRSVDDATAAGIAAFRVVASERDILLRRNLTGMEWPICGPKDVMDRCEELRAADDVSTWRLMLSEYREHADIPRGRRSVLLRHEGTDWALSEVGRVYR